MLVQPVTDPAAALHSTMSMPTFALATDFAVGLQPSGRGGVEGGSRKPRTTGMPGGGRSASNGARCLSSAGYNGNAGTFQRGIQAGTGRAGVSGRGVGSPTSSAQKKTCKS